jgi:diguanylate cyclase (GGDEF)-like protein
MRISINKKVLGVFLAGIVLFGLLAASSFFVIRSLNKSLGETNAVSNMANLTGDLQLQINRLLAPVNHYLITGDIGARDSFDEIVNEISKLLAGFRSFRGGERWSAVVRKVEGLTISYGEKGIDILYIDNPVGNKEAAELTVELNSVGDILTKEADEFHLAAEDELKRMEEKADRLSRRSGIFALTVLTISFLSVLPLYHYLRRFVITPIQLLHEGAGIIGKGNLGHRLEIHTGDELEDLSTEFNRMAESLEETKRELDRRILELFTLYNISKILSTSFETEELLLKIVENISSGLSIDRVMVMLLDDKEEELYIASHTDFVGQDLTKKRFKVGEGLYGRIAAEGKPAMIPDIGKDVTATPEDIFDPHINSVIAAPFGTREKVLGLLLGFKEKPGVFKKEDLKLLTPVSDQVGLALENSMLYKETKLMAITDGLTELFNHRYFMKRLQEEAARAIRYSHPLSLIMIDVDNFKHYNDTHGHPGGDKILRLLAGLLEKNTRSMDIVARYGGEEFTIILPEIERDNAIIMAERIRKEVDEYPFPHEKTQPGGRLTISLGVASLDVDADTDNSDALLKKADDLLYKAKGTGRNKVLS